MSISGVLGSSQKATAVSQILAEGITTKNLSAAIDKHGAVLTPTDKSVLLSLTAAELTTLQSINTKLAPLGINALY